MENSCSDQSTSGSHSGPRAANAVESSLKNTVFAIDRRYTLGRFLGAGAYGVVAAATDQSGQAVAIKKHDLPSANMTFAKRALRELKILRLLRHENVVRLLTVQLPQSREGLNEVYIVEELMFTDLKSVIRSPQPLSDSHCQYLMYQLLKGVEYLHRSHVIHRDLKPRNILVNTDCTLKICDFGLARAFADELKLVGSNLSNYLATRWYRAPELLLNLKKYSTAVDMWGVGVIFAEILARKPLFPGTDNNHQLKLILELLGTPSTDEIKAIPCIRARERVKKFGGSRVEWSDMFKGVSSEALDLLKQLLQFNPDKRLSASQALAHPYLAKFRVLDNQSLATPLDMSEFAFEQQNHTIDSLKCLIYEEISLYHSCPNCL